MPNVTTNAAYQQILSMTLEERSSGYEDLVSNNNALLAVMKRKGLWQTYHGPRIRQTFKSQRTLRSGIAALISCSTLQSISSTTPSLNQSRSSYLSFSRCRRSSTMRAKINSWMCTTAILKLPSAPLRTQWTLHFTGTAALTVASSLLALATAIPIVTNTGVYGGIDRATYAIWRT